MAKHALLSASGAHRWLLCTPSAQLEQKFPASTSAYAEEGTVAHALAELTTRYFLGELDEVAYDESLLYDRKLITLTQMERDFGKKTLAEILGDLIVKPQGAPTLAPESDKRPAYRFEDQVLKAFDE